MTLLLLKCHSDYSIKALSALFKCPVFPYKKGKGEDFLAYFRRLRATAAIATITMTIAAAPMT